MRFGIPTIILHGDDQTAYRDPAAFFFNGTCYLYFTYVDDFCDGPWLHIGETESKDLIHWSPVRILTPRDKRLNYSSPGNIISVGDDFVMCLQTYCRENGEKYGNENCRLYTMRSQDLVSWSAPELIRVKGPDVPINNMGRMIDPYLVNKDDEWWCFYKQNGVSYSRSKDLKTWTFMGCTDAGENSCVVPLGNKYRMFSSPENGIRVMDSSDLIHWKKTGNDIFLGQDEWDWAHGRLTAAFVIRNEFECIDCKYIMFFHASVQDESEDFDKNASIGIAYSNDLETWTW